MYNKVDIRVNQLIHDLICRFHTDCLIEAVLPHFGKERKRKVEELQRELAKVPNNNASR